MTNNHGSTQRGLESVASDSVVAMAHTHTALRLHYITHLATTDTTG